MSMDAARQEAMGDCEHPGEYLRMGDHPEMTGRFVPEDLKPDTLYCLRCERAIEDGFPYPVRLPLPLSDQSLVQDRQSGLEEAR